MNEPCHAYRAQRIIALAGEKQARGRPALDAPLAVLDNAVLLARGGIVEAVESYAAYRRRSRQGVMLTDLGNVCMAPGLINAHCHLELSYLAGRTLSGQGFGSWMRSLVAALREPLPQGHTPRDTALAVQEACGGALRAMLDAGVVHVGDVSGRNAPLVHGAGRAAAQERNLPYPLTHFLEVLGFGPPERADLPPEDIATRVCAPAGAGAVLADVSARCAVSGHALYSTSPEGLRAALAWCGRWRRPFSLHLAESEEEEECLRGGTGPLHEFLAATILPRGWSAPGLGAVEYAGRLGLLTPRTLAVHCVRCSGDDIARLARAGAAVCLCPESNAYIGVGKAPAGKMAEAGIVLCLGTDGLSSNHSLDVRLEMAALREICGFSPGAALRMATVNGAACLGLHMLGTLEPGRAACFSLWDADAFSAA